MKALADGKTKSMMPDSLNLIVNITSVNMLSRQHIQHKIPFPSASRF